MNPPLSKTELAENSKAILMLRDMEHLGFPSLILCFSEELHTYLDPAWNHLVGYGANQGILCEVSGKSEFDPGHVTLVGEPESGEYLYSVHSPEFQQMIAFQINAELGNCVVQLLSVGELLIDVANSFLLEPSARNPCCPVIIQYDYDGGQTLA